MGKSSQQEQLTMQNRTDNGFNHVSFTCSAEKTKRKHDDGVEEKEEEK